MTSSFFVYVALLALAGHVSSTSIIWTGYAGDNQWTTNNNWYPNNIPGQYDDVTIDKGVVICTIPTGVASLTMGTSVEAPANLTLFHAFAVGASGLNVKSNGNLIVDSGLETVTGGFNIDGTLTFNSGFVSGVWSISNRGVGYFPGQGQRNIYAGSMTNSGVMYLSGVVGLNASAQFINNAQVYATGELQFMVFDNSPAFVNSASGNLTFTGSVMRFQAPAVIGNINLVSGDIELYNVVTFTTALNIPSGSTVSSMGDANVTFNSISGAGTVKASGAVTTFTTLNNIASVVAAGGNTFFTKGASATMVTLSGGNVNLGSDVYGQTLVLQGGILLGKGTVSGSTVTIGTEGLNIGVRITILSMGSVSSPSLLSFTTGGQLIIAFNATLTVPNTFNVTGPSGTAGVLNNGTIIVSSILQSQNIDITGAGAVTVSGRMLVSTATLSQNLVSLTSGAGLSGSNAVLQIDAIAASPSTGSIQAIVGDYSVKCSGACFSVSSPGSADAFAFSYTQ